MSRSRARAALATLVVFLGLESSTLSAQTASGPQRDSFWLGVGLGAGSEDFAGHLNGSYQFGASIISLRTAATVGLFDDGFVDYALLYGRATRAAAKRYHASAALGVAFVDGCRGEGLGGCQDESAGVGLPIELQASWRPGSLIGVGLYGFANLNGMQSFAGVTLGLQVGRLK